MNVTDLRILVVEDNPGDAFLIEEMLRTCKTTSARFSVVERMEEALGYLAEQNCDIVLLRHRLADGSIRDVEVYSGIISLGKKEFIHSIIHDITEKLLLEAQFGKFGIRGPYCRDGGRGSRSGRCTSGEFRLLVTDVVMPEMNGRELAELLRERLPGLKFLFMSGYTTSVIAANGVLDEGINFIQKSFSKKDLAEKVHAVLG